MDKQTRIFAPFNQTFPPGHWYENILGRIIKPITEKWNGLDWFWFSKYVHALGNDSKSEDCDVTKVNPPYVSQQYGNITTSIRFRYSLADMYCENFETEFKELIQSQECFITDFRPWDKVGDVGSGRHLGGQITEKRKQSRAERNARLYHQISLLTLDTIEGPDVNQNYKIETNNSQNDPPQHQFQAPSSFHTPHHLFCNITGVTFPVWVTVRLRGNEMTLKTETGYGGSDYEGGPFTIDQNPKPMVVKF